MLDKIINGKLYKVNSDEFNKVFHETYNNLNILELLGFYERLVGLIRDLSIDLNLDYLVCQSITLGGWIPIQLKECFRKIYLFQSDKGHLSNIIENIGRYKVENVVINRQDCKDSYILLIDNCNIDEKLVEHIRRNRPVVLSVNKLPSGIYSHQYTLSKKYSFAGEKDINVYIPEVYHNKFLEEFGYFIESPNILNYDNLIHLTIMVKNAGDSFEEVLTKNLPIIDRWTILDTGSTDNTIDIINRVLVGKKKGELHQEPFKNFRDSRNKCLDLAGNKCKYTLMLDDTYIIEGELRDFLNTCRGDQFGTSYSMYIKSDDSQYTSNRIVKTENKLRYIYKIHEVIQSKDNVNVCIPIEKCWIFDYRCDYMENRTMSRKEYDIKLLFEEVEENPQDPRHLYYIAQTYNLMEKHELALEYFLKRGDHPVEGFVQEKADALFEAARICNFKLNRPWEECEKLYMRSYELDTSRPESMYFIGIHHYLEQNYNLAYDYMLKGFKIGYPIHTQHSLKPTLSFHYLPKFLAELAYRNKNWQLGFDACKLFLNKNKKEDDSWDTMVSWKNIFTLLTAADPLSRDPYNPKVPYICFIADGGFTKWTGRDILTQGVGGSETYIIEMARYMKVLSGYEVIVFCNTDKHDIFEDVKYMPISETLSFFSKNVVKHCIISRYSEYIPLISETYTENIHLVLHDLTPTGVVIPRTQKLKNVFCLTQWHCDYFKDYYPLFADITKPFYYGIDTDKLTNDERNKIPYKFIYSSTANRGLLILLELWPKILERYPTASLSILCDLENSWVNQFAPQQVKIIKEYLELYKNHNIKMIGWSSKEILYNEWKTASVWFYPCIFAETFCLTALEAAVSKTLAVTNDLAGLKETVGDRGVVIPGNAANTDWKERALSNLFEVLDNREKTKNYINKNYDWAKNMTWKYRAKEMLETHLEIRVDYNLTHTTTTTTPTPTTTTTTTPTTTTTTTSTVKKVLENTILYYNFKNSCLSESNSVLIVGNSPENIKDLLNSTITQQEDLLDILDTDKKYNMIYLGYDDVSYLDYCVSWKSLKSGGFLLALKENRRFTDKFENSINLLNSDGIIVLEKIN